MKKYIYLLSCCACLFGMMTVVGCGDKCNDADCQKDVDFPDYMERRIPYKVGQVVRFANATGDTIILTCDRKEYYDQPITPSSNFEMECCNAAFVGNVVCALNSNEIDNLGMTTSFVPTSSSSGGFYVTNYSALLDNVDYLEDDYYGHQQDIVELNDEKFMNVLVVDKDSTFIMYNSLDGLGVVGFKINGEEWALVE